MTAEMLPQVCPLEAEALRQQNILIVDDDAPLVEALTLRLRQQGFDVLTAGSGAEALSVAPKCRPSLILLDLRLPDTNGWQVCTQLSDDQATCHIPVIILSGMERPDIIRRSRAAGCQYFVRKPYDPNALLILIRHAIAEASEWQAV